MRSTYETERLLLKIPDVSQATQVLEYYVRNQEFFKEWDAAKGEAFYTLACQEKLLAKDLEDLNSKVNLRYWIYKKEDTNLIIGTVSFTSIIRGVFLSCFLGYKLDKDEINKGYMTEAVGKGITVMFEDYGLHRIEANIMPKNLRSLKVVEKLGFHNEGLALKYLKINGKWEDHIHMVLLNKSMD